MNLFVPASWPVAFSSGVFLACVAVIAVAGVRLTGVIDMLADRTRIGEALAGAVLLLYALGLLLVLVGGRPPG